MQSVSQLHNSSHLIELTHGSVTYSDSKIGFAPQESFSDTEYILKGCFDKERLFENQKEYRFVIDFNQIELPKPIIKKLKKSELFHCMNVSKLEMLQLPTNINYFTKIY